MLRCPLCQSDLPQGYTSCPSCGTSVDDVATRRLESPKSPAADQRSHSFDSIDDARFVPGTILGARYRIVGLLGKGGMGEVYRADDLKLSQPVALKFLPHRLLRDGASLARFHREVRVARQVSHKNVCRVYDIGETDGHHFLSMEYIKGEELSSLLRRIGRLPVDKAIQISRQICAGLAAAHESGVLHRDLKPANVMIDADGNARITDFGLAGLAEEFREEDMGAGTPAYMAPEQLDGSAVTVRSDIYSLGLVLYELFTGKKAFEAPSLNELINLRRSDATPTSPTSLVRELDPVIESVIERCLKKDASQRPSTALQVAAALPGGDPIAAALAAGETPSPEMVAAAPKTGTLRPTVALGLLASVLVLLAVPMLLSSRIASHRLMPLEKSPEVLKEQATQIAKSFGYTSPFADSMYGFETDRDYYQYLNRNRASINPWESFKYSQPSVIRFWYRLSPNPLVPYNSQFVTRRDPPNETPGMVRISLDTEGKLAYFEAVPEQIDAETRGHGDAETNQNQNTNSDEQTGSRSPSPRVSASPSLRVSPSPFQPLFTAAGLDITRFQPIESTWVPPQVFDTRQAWSGVYPTIPNIPITIEAASYRGRPVYFQIITPWATSRQQPSGPQTPGDRMFFWILLAIFFAIMVVASLLALKNLRTGRSDRRGAFRTALFLFIARMIFWLFSTHHVAQSDEMVLLLTGLQSALFWACFVGLLYLALEPYLRRHWPQRTISWNRLLAGDFRDPLVGRDILIGAVLGSLTVTLMYLRLILPKWLGVDRGMPDVIDGFETSLAGISAFMQMAINQLTASIVQAFMMVFLFLFLSLLFRKDWLGTIAGFLIIAALFLAGLAANDPILSLIFILISNAAFVFCAVRFGPLALMSCLVFFHLWVFFPITTDFTAWYATTFILDLVLLLTIAIYSYYISLGGQSPFKMNLLPEN